MQRNIKLVLEYEGTRYHGWQVQENAVTVQGELEKALLKLTGRELRVTGAGRTDSGVHARGQVAHFLLEKPLSNYQVIEGINAHLPEDIAVVSAEDVGADFHARYSAKRRTYKYYVYAGHTALLRKYCWQVFRKFDRKCLNQMAAILVGDHDFSSFARLETESKHKRCIVYKSRWSEEPPLSVFTITANRFLHGMVRTLVGTMMDVAFGNYTVERFGEIFRLQKRVEAGPAAPAKGLILEKVEYDEED